MTTYKTRLAAFLCVLVEESNSCLKFFDIPVQSLEGKVPVQEKKKHRRKKVPPVPNPQMKSVVERSSLHQSIPFQGAKDSPLKRTCNFFLLLSDLVQTSILCDVIDMKGCVVLHPSDSITFQITTGSYFESVRVSGAKRYFDSRQSLQTVVMSHERQVSLSVWENDWNSIKVWFHWTLPFLQCVVANLVRKVCQEDEAPQQRGTNKNFARKFESSSVLEIKMCSAVRRQSFVCHTSWCENFSRDRFVTDRFQEQQKFFFSVCRCSEARNQRALSMLKRPKGLNGLHKQKDTDAALECVLSLSCETFSFFRICSLSPQWTLIS